MNPTWYAIMTGPRQEPTADRNLRDQGYKTFYPFERVRKRRKIANRDSYLIHWVEQPYFPRYIFAAVSPGQSLYAINETHGVSSVVYCGDEPLPIPHEVMDELMNRANTKGGMRDVDTVSRKRYSAGETVRFADNSPFAGLIAQVAVDSGKEVSVWLKTFGIEREISVGPGLLEIA